MKKNFKLFKIGIFLALILGFALGQDAYADGTWDGGAGDGLWNSAANWGGDALPAVTDDVVIGAGIAVVVDADDEVNSITLGAGSSLIDDGTARTLTVREDIDLSAASASITQTAAGGLNLIMGQATAANTPAITVAATSTLTVGVFTIDAANTFDTDVTLSGDMSCTQLLIDDYGEIGAVNGAADEIIVLGNITLSTANDGGIGTNTTDPSLIIGDVNLATSTTCTLTQGVSGDVNVANITLYNAAVDLVGSAANDVMNIAGDFTLAGASALTTDATNMVDVTFNASSTLTVSDDSFASFNVIDIAAGTLTTADDFTVIQLNASAGTLNQTDGTCYLNAGAADALTGGGGITPTFNNLYINATAVATATTLNGVTINGDLTKVGSSFTFTAVPVTFSNTTAKELVISGTMIFFDIQVAANSSVTTNSSFQIGDLATTGSTLTVASGGSFVANTGTITLEADGAGGGIVNITLDNQDSDPSSLTFSKVIIDDNDGTGIVEAANDFVVTGDFEVTANGTFQNYNSATTTGKVVFSNTVQRTITNAGTLEFGKIEIAPSSSVTTASSFIITNGDNADSSGVDVKATGTFGATAGTITFGGTTEDAQNKVIENAGTLEFFALTIADVANNNVVTDDSFTIKNNVTATSTGAQSNFTASSPSVITFDNTGAHTIANATSEADLVLFDIVCDNQAVNLTADHFVTINGDITVNGASGQFTTGTSTGATGLVKLSGTAQQLINGTGGNALPVSIARLEVDKANAPAGVGAEDEVSLGLDVVIVDDANSDVILTNGKISLNAQTFDNGGLIAQTNGFVDGGSGLYIITRNGGSTIFSDDFFRENSTDNGTLWNLEVAAAENLDGNLRVNNDLTLNQALTIDDATNGFELHVFGNITQGAATNDITYVAGRADEAKVILDGAGSVTGLGNTLFTPAKFPSIEFRRAETLAGAATMEGTGSVATLTMNSGTQNLDLNGQVLTFEDNSLINIVSGQILASATGSGVVLGTTHLEVPANIFVNDEVKDFTSNAEITLLGNLTILGTFKHNTDDNVYTKDNILTFGPSCTVTTNAFDDAKHIIGNLRKTVSGSTATLFEVGGGDANAFRPVSIKFATSTTSQVVQVSSVLTNPTIGKAGDITRAIESEWTITPVGTVSNTFDSVQVNFGWGSDQANGLTAANDQSFAARWDGSVWEDYRNSSMDDAALADADVAAAPGSAADGLFMAEYASYPLSSTDFGGTWAVFHATTASDDATKDAAIALAEYKLVFTSLSSTVESGIPFNGVVQLQDQYGNPQNAVSAITIDFTTNHPDASLAVISAVIPQGSNQVSVPGLLLTGAGYTGVELIATTSAVYDDGDGFNATVYGMSDAIDILSTQPAVQASMLTLTNTTPGYVDMDVQFLETGTNNSDYAIVVAKAGSAIDSEEFPVDGTSYIGNNVFGAGSIIGDGVVVYNGPADNGGGGATLNYSFKMSGLAPGVTYYLRVFSYAGTSGSENYNTNPGPLSSRSLATTSETDDDVAFGANDTRATAKPIGANSAVSGTIADDTDEDWFSFMVTSAASNVRVKLTGVPADYNLELYNADNRRVRRATLSGTESEYVVINNLDAGTYSIRIYGVDGAYSATPYTVEVQTRDTEIFSVTQ